MTPELQRIRIAESRAWKEESPVGGMSIQHITWDGKQWKQFSLKGVVNCLPDYLNSRDAMAEALAGLAEGKGKEFVRQLYGVFERSYETFEHTAGEPVLTAWFLLNATPAQLAEAYLRTKGLWED